MADNTYTPVTDGFHDCKIVFAKRAEKHYGKEIKGHVVFEMKLVATDTDVENPAAYKAEFAILLTPGFEWDFYNEKLGRREWRKATAADTKATLDYAIKCFPAWKTYCDGLDEGSNEAAFAWFADRSLTDGVTVRAKLTNAGSYTGNDGLEHERLNARIYAPFEQKPKVANDEAAQISKALKAAGVKLFGKPKSASATATPSKPTMPPPPAKPSVDKLREEAFAVYQSIFTDDKTGACFYPKCAEIIGSDVNTWESWSADDWTKIKQTFECPF